MHHHHHQLPHHGHHHGIHFVIHRPGWGGILLIILLTIAFWTLRHYSPLVLEYSHEDDIEQTTNKVEAQDDPPETDSVNADSPPVTSSNNEETVSSLTKVKKSPDQGMTGNMSISLGRGSKSSQTSSKGGIAIESRALTYTHVLPSLYGLYHRLIRVDLSFDNALSSFVFMNMCFVATIGLTMLLEKLLFGTLRSTERRLVMERCMTLVFYHVLFLFGICSVENFEDLLFWVTWFLGQAVLQHFTVLSIERLKFVLTSTTGNVVSVAGTGGAPEASNANQPGTNNASWTSAFATALFSTVGFTIVRLFVVLIGLQITLAGLLGALVYMSSLLPWNVLWFLVTQLGYLALHNAHSLLRLSAYLLWGVNTTSTYATLFSQGTTWFYYVSLGLELSTVLMDMAHYCLMLVWTQHYITMAALVVLFHLRHLCQDFTSRWKRHKSFMLLRKRIRDCFPLVVKDKSETGSAILTEPPHEEETCAICWDQMFVFRRLPCKHEFHEGCLLSWLVQDLSCPVCRRSLTQELRGPQLQTPPHHHRNGNTTQGDSRPPSNNDGSTSTSTDSGDVSGVSITSHREYQPVASNLPPLEPRSSDTEQSVVEGSSSPATSGPGTSPPPTPPYEGTEHNFTTTYQFNASRFFRWLPSITLEIARFQGNPVGAFHEQRHGTPHGTELVGGGGAPGVSLPPSPSLMSGLVQDTDVAQLQELFPHVSRHRLHQVLLQNDGALEEAIEYLLEGDIEDDEEVEDAQWPAGFTFAAREDELHSIGTSSSPHTTTPGIDVGTSSLPSPAISEVASSPVSLYTNPGTSQSPATFCSTFSSQASLREKSFRERKQMMLDSAKEKYQKTMDIKKTQ